MGMMDAPNHELVDEAMDAILSAPDELSRQFACARLTRAQAALKVRENEMRRQLGLLAAQLRLGLLSTRAH